MSSKTKNLGLLKKDPILDKNDTFNIQTMLNDNWDKLDGAVGGGFQQAKAYTDEQISLVTATGIPKLVSYPLQVTATEDKQTSFEIPLDTFEVATDTLIVVINRAFLDASQYTVKDAVRDETGELVKRAELVLAKGVAEGSELSLLVMKNVPIGEDGAINGAVLAKGSVPIDRVSGLDEKLVESKVELSNATNGTRETVAATEKAVKTAYDRANEAFQSASNGKTQIATAITGKGVSASGSDTFAQLASKVSSISVGAKVTSHSIKHNSIVIRKSYSSVDIYTINTGITVPSNIKSFLFEGKLDTSLGNGHTLGEIMDFDYLISTTFKAGSVILSTTQREYSYSSPNKYGDITGVNSGLIISTGSNSSKILRFYYPNNSGVNGENSFDLSSVRDKALTIDIAVKAKEIYFPVASDIDCTVSFIY